MKLLGSTSLCSRLETCQIISDLSKLDMHINSNENQIDEDLILLHEIYPNLSWKELIEAKENLDRYFNLAVRIWCRLEGIEDPRRSEF